jgi:hypothetical protein
MPGNYQKGLVAPTVPVAEFDGLIKVVDLESDVVVHLPVWNTAQQHDTYQLLLNGVLVGPAMIMPHPTPEPGTELTLTIPVETYLMADATYAVGYRAINISGGSSADSALTHIHVDRTPPGAVLLAPLLFPNITVGETLTGMIPGYAGMATGDVIRTLCNDIDGPSVTVQPDNLIVDPVSILFDRSFLQSLNSDQVTLGYRITDRAGNTSILSQLVNLTLQV